MTFRILETRFYPVIFFTRPDLCFVLDFINFFISCIRHYQFWLVSLEKGRHHATTNECMWMCILTWSVWLIIQLLFFPFKLSCFALIREVLLLKRKRSGKHTSLPQYQKRAQLGYWSSWQIKSSLESDSELVFYLLI